MVQGTSVFKDPFKYLSCLIAGVNYHLFSCQYRESNPAWVESALTTRPWCHLYGRYGQITNIMGDRGVNGTNYGETEGSITDQACCLLLLMGYKPLLEHLYLEWCISEYTTPIQAVILRLSGLQPVVSKLIVCSMHSCSILPVRLSLVNIGLYGFSSTVLGSGELPRPTVLTAGPDELRLLSLQTMVAK